MSTTAKTTNDIIRPEEVMFMCFFNDTFVCYEKWGASGWMYSTDTKTWDYEKKYAINGKILIRPLSING